MVLLMSDLNIGATGAGLLITVASVVGGIAAVPIGAAMVKTGPRVMAVISILLALAGCLLAALLPNYTSLMVSRIFDGTAMGVIAVVVPTVIAAHFPEEKRGLPMGIWSCWVSIGYIIVLQGTALLGDGRTNWIPFGCGIMMKDIVSGEIRETTKQDIMDCARITEALDEYDVCMQTVVAQNVPEHVEELHSFVGHAFNTNKNVTVGPMGKRSAEALVELASIIAGGKEKLQERPFLNFGGCTISPLTIPGSTCQAIIVGAPNNIPIGTLSMAMSGGMSPVKITGSLVVDLAETLGALVLAQTVKKGAAMMMGISNGMLDLRHNALAELGCPEAALLSAGFAQMCNFYDVPSLVGGT